ncbi:MAG: PAS domain S-box protein [Deltaproteobacteria bacterium]|nr:PAS domain S-box protein [Candidatus Anaeroferrophillus wilburensis]MBN2890093.1 PAS domain S-box protein [Deltaproteobacteria bacterium]
MLAGENFERLQSQASLKESEEWLRILIDAIPDIICLKDAAGRRLIANTAYERLFQLEGIDYRGKTDDELVRLYPQLSSLFTTLCKKTDQQAWMYGGSVRLQEVIPDAEGEKTVFDIVKVPIVHHDGSPKGLVSIGRDITVARQKSRALRESEEKYRAVLESNPDPVVVYDREGLVVYFNPAFTEVFGWTMAECAGRRLDHFVPEDTWPLTRMMIDKVKVGESFSGIETSRYTKDGLRIPVTISAAIYHDLQGMPLGSVINLRDISSQKELEAKLQRAQKMEGIGLLAAGVAHDLNNVLAGLVSYPELLLQRVSHDDPLRKALVTIQKSGEKAAAIVSDLLTLARRGVTVDEVVNLNRIIRDYLKSPEGEKLLSLHPTVSITTCLAPDLLNIVGSPVHLLKTMMNLIGNAAESMPEGGVIRIETANRYLDGGMNGYDGLSEGDHVVVQVADDGVGIAPTEVEKIFEPFYSKKIMGRSGTGLGMAIIWNTVHDHHGSIDVQSSEGQGTTFSLFFPASRRQLAKAPGLLSPEEYAGRGETILVVDDQEEQRQIAAEMLGSLGYDVMVAASGEAAVAYLQNNKVDLVVLDMIMTGIDGLETYKQITACNPGQKTIIASGYSESGRVHEAQRLGAGAYVKKPYLLEKIGLAVRRTLDG